MNQYVQFEHKGETFVINGSDRSIEAFKAIYEFYTEVLKGNPTARDMKIAHYPSDAMAGVLHRLDELEKNVYALSTQPISTKEYERRMRLLDRT